MHEAGWRRRGVLAGLAGLPLAGCVSGLAETSPRAFTVATFNIWHDAGGNWPVRRRLLADALRDVDADIIALQEVLEDAGKGLPNQAETLARELDYPEPHFVAVEEAGAAKRYGNAVLTRLPVIEVARRKLQPLSDFRTAIRVRVAAAGAPVDVVATHLAWQADAGAVRAKQVADLLAWLPNGGVPLILMGDFNATLDDAGLAALGPPRFVSALPAGAASTTLNPAQGHGPRVIDHIFVEQSAFAVEEARVIGDVATDGVYPSDHFGVAARVTPRS